MADVERGGVVEELPPSGDIGVNGSVRIGIKKSEKSGNIGIADETSRVTAGGELIGPVGYGGGSSWVGRCSGRSRSLGEVESDLFG